VALEQVLEDDVAAAVLARVPVDAALVAGKHRGILRMAALASTAAVRTVRLVAAMMGVGGKMHRIAVPRAGIFLPSNGLPLIGCRGLSCTGSDHGFLMPLLPPVISLDSLIGTLLLSALR